MSKGERSKLTCSPDFAYVSNTPQQQRAGTVRDRSGCARFEFSILSVVLCACLAAASGLLWCWRRDPSERHSDLRCGAHLVPVNGDSTVKAQAESMALESSSTPCLLPLGLAQFVCSIFVGILNTPAIHQFQLHSVRCSIAIWRQHARARPADRARDAKPE